MATTGLLRTNNKLTGNVKISISSKDEIFLNSIEANKELSDSRFKKFKVNPTSKYSIDVKRFFDNGRLPTDIIFNTKRNSDDLSSKDDFTKHYENQYAYGTSRCDSDLFVEAYCIFAPILIEKKIPRYFVVFKNPKARNIEYVHNPNVLNIGRTYRVVGDIGFEVKYGTTSYTNGQSFKTDIINGTNYLLNNDTGYVVLDDPEYEYDKATNPNNIVDDFISPSNIVKVFDLTEKSNIGKYIKNHIDDPLYNGKSLVVDYENSEIFYNGIDITSGVMSDASENIENLTDKELDIIDFDELLTQGYERNKMLSSNILNLEFLFDDTESEPYTFNRYYGFYVDDIDVGSFNVDGAKMFSKSGLYENPYYDKQILPKYYGKYATDNDGIKIIPEEIIGVEGYVFRKHDIVNKPSYFYLKDKNGDFHKINNNKSVTDYTIMDSRIDTEKLFGFSNNRFELEAFRPKGAGKSSMILTVNNSVYTGYKFEIFDGKKSLGFIIGDHLPNVTIYDLQDLESRDYTYDRNTPYQAGENIGYYFYPTGTKEQIAIAIAGAIDYLLFDISIDAIQNENKIYLKSKYAGALHDNIHILLPEEDYSVTTSNTYMLGGNLTNINRIVVDIDYPVDITTNSYLQLTDGGYAKINSISPYLEEPIYDEAGVIVNYKGINSYKVIDTVEQNKEVKINKGTCAIYNKQKLSFGVFSIYDVKDFDFDTLTSSYNTANVNEYKKYFKFPEDNLTLGEYYSIYKSDSATTIPTVIYSGITIAAHNGEITDVNIGMNTISVAGDSTASYVNGSYVRITNSTDNDGIYKVDSSVFVSSETVISLNALTPLVSDTNIDGYSKVMFKAVIDKNYIVGVGKPIVIAEKYYDDEELKKFIGFSALDTGEHNVVSSNIFDADDLKNKYDLLLFDSTRVEYNRLRENGKSKNALKSKIIPNINKWVLENGKNIRDIDYRLNLSKSFGEMNFSPSFIDQQQQTRYFTHEWLYLASIPEKIDKEDLKNSTSYFSKPFSVSNLNDKNVDYFSEYFTVDDYIVRLPIADSIVQTETNTLTSITGGIINIKVNGIEYKQIFNTNDLTTINDWVASHAAALAEDGVTVSTTGIADITFSAIKAGDPFATELLDAGTDGIWLTTNVVENKGYELIEVDTQYRYTEFVKVSDDNYETFFRGVKIKMLSNSTDYSKYKFSAILNFHKSEIFLDRPPFEVTLVENKDFKNLTLVVDVIIDDYKVLPEMDGEIFGEYIYLYVMESLKRMNSKQDGYEFGIDFAYPDTSPIILRGSDVFGDPNGNQTAPPIGPPLISFKGYQLFHKTDMANIPNIDSIKFNTDRFLLTDFFGVRNDGSFGRLIGMNEDGVFVITSTNPYYSASEYIVDRPNTILDFGNQENIIQLKANGFSIVQIPSLSAVGSYNPSIVNTGIYQLDDLTWFHELGGNNVYKRLAEYLSFGSIQEIINKKDTKHIKYKVISGGIMKDNVETSLKFIKPSVINRSTSLKTEANNIQFAEIPEQIITDYTSIEDGIPYAFNRYGGNFVPKMKGSVKYKNDKLVMAWGLNSTTWEDVKYTWQEFDIRNPEIKSIPFSRRLFGLNTKFDISYKKFGVIENMFYHKVSSTSKNLTVLEEPIYPQIGEIAIGTDDYNIFLGDFDSKFYKNYTDKNIKNDINGSFGLADVKSFMNTKLLQLQELLTIENFITILQDNDIDNPNYNIDINDLVYEIRGGSIYFRINVSKLITDFITSKLTEEFPKYVNIFNTPSDNITSAIKTYVDKNITNLYKIREVVVFVKKYNQDANIPLIKIELNDLILLQNGYRIDKNINLAKITELESVIKYKLDNEFSYSFSIKAKIGIGNI